MVYYHYAEKTGVNFHVADLIEVSFKQLLITLAELLFSKHLLIFQLLLGSSSPDGIWVLPSKQNEDLEIKLGVVETYRSISPNNFGSAEAFL